MATVFDPQQVPREMRLRVKAAAFFDFARLFVLGALAFGMGVWFLFGMLSLNTYRSLVFNGPFLTTQGEIIDVQETPFCAGRCSRGGHIFEYRYRYKVDGKTLSGTGYGAESSDLKAGTRLKIEYRVEKPDWSRVDEWSKPRLSMTVKPHDGLLAPAFFSLVGAVLLFVGLRRGFKNMALATHGVVVWGKAETSTNTQGLLSRLYRFKTRAGIEVTARIAQVWRQQAPRLNDNEQLIYDQRNPQNAVSFRSVSRLVQNVCLETAPSGGPVQPRPLKELDPFKTSDPLQELEQIDAAHQALDQRATKKMPLKSVLANVVIVGCMAAVGVFEFQWLLRGRPDQDVLFFLLYQLIGGVITLVLGSSLISLFQQAPLPDSGSALREASTARMPLAKFVGGFAMVVGTVLTMSALAALLYVGYRAFNA